MNAPKKHFLWWVMHFDFRSNVFFIVVAKESRVLVRKVWVDFLCHVRYRRRFTKAYQSFAQIFYLIFDAHLSLTKNFWPFFQTIYHSKMALILRPRCVYIDKRCCTKVQLRILKLNHFWFTKALWNFSKWLHFIFYEWVHFHNLIPTKDIFKQFWLLWAYFWANNKMGNSIEKRPKMNRKLNENHT